MEAGHGWQGEDAAMVEENVPAGQETQAVLRFAPAFEENLYRAESQRHETNQMQRDQTYVPVLQGMHTDAADELKVGEKVPGGHGMHVTATR